MIGFLRRFLPLLAVLVLAGAIYDGWIFYSRWEWRREADRARANTEAERDRAALKSIGGGGFQILNFYGSPATIRPGQPANICYSVTGAATLRLDPPVADVYPALSHCVQAAPRKDTEFTLTATDSAGHTATAKFTLRVIR